MILPFLLVSIEALGFQNPKCPTKDPSNRCYMDVEAEYFDCFGGCHFDKLCEKLCETEANQKVSQCPCYTNCYDGCPCSYESPYCDQENCESLHENEINKCKYKAEAEMNWCYTRCDEYDYACQRKCVQSYEFAIDACPCGKNCESGCPCPYYPCDAVTSGAVTATMATTTTAMPIQDVHLLMFNPGWTGVSPQSKQLRFSWYLQSTVLQEESHPWQMDTLESYDQDRTYMCSFKLKDEMWIIGGPTSPFSTSQPQRQFRVYVDHMEEMHTLPFKFEQGLCTDINDEQAMACADSHEPQHCWIFDAETEVWSKTQDTTNNHHQGAIARYNDSVVILSGKDNNQGSTEYFNIHRRQWSIRSNDTMFQNINGATAVSHHGKLYFFGGFDNQVNGTALNTVYHLVEYYWTDEFFWYVSEFTLQHPRYNHRTVIQGDIILHVGGPSFQNIEAWIYRPDVSDENEQKYLIRHTRFETYNWFSYPEVFVMKPSDVIQPA